MFKNKRVKIIKKQVVVEPEVVNPSIQMVDVNMAITRSKVTKNQVFKDREPIKKESTTHWKRNRNYRTLLSKL
jgi:nuclear transport factor 2 (NTF2) superfamily protein